MAGVVSDGFEKVQAVFEEGAADLGAGGGAFSVTVDGESVVDLWAGSRRPGVAWERDTIATLMSTTKGLTALCAQVLWSRGQLDVDAPVGEYWPEFACNGKEKATVRQVLDHTVGVLGLPAPERLLDWQGNGWDDHDAIAEQLASAVPAWEPGTRIGYHAISCGWLTGELVRRVTGRTVGTFFRDEIAQPLGLDAWIGTPATEHDRLALVVPESRDDVPAEVLEVDGRMRALFDDPSSPLGVAAIAMHGGSIISRLDAFMNLPAVRSLEIAAANGTAGGRDLARLYGMLACGGEIDGVRLVSEESVQLFSAVSGQGRSAITPPVTLPGGVEVPPPFTTYGLGYARNVPEPGQPPAFGPHVETFGHAGHGGQIGFADPVRRVGVGFVRSHLSLVPVFAGSLIGALYECLG